MFVIFRGFFSVGAQVQRVVNVEALLVRVRVRVRLGLGLGLGLG